MCGFHYNIAYIQIGKVILNHQTLRTIWIERYRKPFTYILAKWFKGEIYTLFNPFISLSLPWRDNYQLSERGGKRETIAF